MREYFPPVKVGDAPLARDENRIRAFLNGLANMINQGGLEAVNIGGTLMLRRPRQPEEFFYAQLDSLGFDHNGTACFGWKQAVKAADGTFTLLTNGLSGTPSLNPAYEVNGATNALVGSTAGRIVKMWPGFPNDDTNIGQEYLFELEYEQFYAKITGSGTDGSGNPVYAWTEQKPTTNGGYSALAGGRTGTTTVNPAYELNQTSGVANNTIVLMWCGFLHNTSTKQEFVFMAPSSGGGGSTTIQVPTNICVSFLVGPLSVADGGTGSTDPSGGNSANAGPTTVVSQGSVGGPLSSGPMFPPIKGLDNFGLH